MVQNLDNAANTARTSVSILMGIAILAVLALGALQRITTESLTVTAIAVFGGLAAVIWMTGRAAHRAIAVLRKAVRSGV